jgi:hypothetical protein
MEGVVTLLVFCSIIVGAIFVWAKMSAAKPYTPPALVPVVPDTTDRTLAANFPTPDDFMSSYLRRLTGAWNPRIPPLNLLKEMVGVATLIYEMESLFNPIPPLHSSDPILIGRYRDDLERHLRRIADAPRTLGIVTDAITRSLQSLRDALPDACLVPLSTVQQAIDDAPPPLTVPILALVDDLPRCVFDVAIAYYTEDIAELRLFVSLKRQLDQNDGDASRGSGTYVRPWEYNGTPQEIVNQYLGNTPLRDLFTSSLPFELPDEARFAGHWVLSPPGRGKTTLLHALVMDDIQKPDACLILMDSKGDLIQPIRELAEIQDRLVLIDPDPENPIAINPLDIGQTNLARSVDLLEYLFASLLEFKMTAMQTTLFRSVLRALVTTFPNPTLETFRDLLSNGYEKYATYVARLPHDLKDFFEKDFNDRSYADRRREVLQRLRLLLDNDTMRAMLTATTTRFHIGEAMDTGRIVIINNSKAQLGDQGAEFFGRFFIAQVLAAAQQRSTRRSDQKPPVYFYIDECQTVISRDEKIPTILDECRSQNIALIMAHQRTKQIASENVLDALSNCAIRFANSDEEARALAPRLRTTPEFLQSLRRGTFAAYVRDSHTQGVAVTVSRADLSGRPRITAAEARMARERMRRDYGIPLQIASAAPQEEPPSPPQAEETPEPPQRSRPPRRGTSTGATSEGATDWT